MSAIGDDNLITCMREGVGNLSANTATCAGNEGNFILKAHLYVHHDIPS